MIDLANYTIVRRTYENFKSELSGCTNVIELKLKVQKFIQFISSIEAESNLKNFISKQKDIAKKILLVINIRYLLIFIYKYLVQKLVSELISLINRVLVFLNNR